jgi:two-component system secretion response regulator SsrB
MMPTTSSKCRVVIVDDHSLIVDGIRNLLAPLPRFDVVGTGGDGLEVYALCRDLTPDLVIIDLGLPGMNGLDAIRQIKSRWPQLQILTLTASDEEHKAAETLAAGANGYVLKRSSPQILLGAIQTVAAGSQFLDPSLELVPEESGQADETPLPEFSLTPRERQLLKLIGEGKRNRDIAELLSLSLKTVESHRLNLMRKLDAHSAVDLVHWCRRLNI